MLVEPAPGASRELADLTGADVEGWGRALGRLHDAGRQVDRSAVPAWPALVRAAVRGCGDPAVAEATAALARAGAPVAPARPSRAGRLVEVVPSGLPGIGDLLAMLVEPAPGASRELADLTGADVEGWGRALGRLHDAGRQVDRSAVPAWPALVRAAVRGCGDPAVAEAVERAVRRCTELLGPPDALVHGDPQPDNAGWTPAGPVLFDLDDLAVSWAVADLAMAVRDAQPIEELDRPVTATPVGRLLLRGYRAGTPLNRDQEQAVPALQRLAGAVTYARLRAATRPTGPDAPTGPTGPTGPHGPEPAWLVTLRARLVAVADRLRPALLAPPPR